MCSLASLQRDPFKWLEMSSKINHPSSFSDELSKRAQEEYRMNNQHRVNQQKMQMQWLIDSLKNQDRDQLFRDQLQRRYAVFKNSLIPKYQLKHFLNLLQQHHPRSSMYQYQYPKMKRPAPMSMLPPLDNKLKGKSKEKIKSPHSLITSAIKTGLNIWKTLF